MTAMTSPSWARVRGPLAPYAGGFRVELERLGYTPLTAATHVRLVAHLSWWLAREGADVVSASRYMRGGHQVGGPFFKRLMSRTAGLTLHWFAGVPTHDPTNNFKLYRRSFLDATPIQSSAGFELALELTVKATLDGRRVEEVPTTWRDRTSGQSNFKLRKWLPHYLHWYGLAFSGRLRRVLRRGPRRHGTGIGPDSKR